MSHDTVVRLELDGNTARLLLHGTVDRHSLDQLGELAEHLTEHADVETVQLRLVAPRFGADGAAELRRALAGLETRLRTAGAQLSVSSSTELPEAAVPDALTGHG